MLSTDEDRFCLKTIAACSRHTGVKQVGGGGSLVSDA